MEDDRKILNLLANGPVSLSGCGSYLGMDRKTFENVIEDFLFREGYITRGSRGRDITEEGMKILTHTNRDQEKPVPKPRTF